VLLVLLVLLLLLVLLVLQVQVLVQVLLVLVLLLLLESTGLGLGLTIELLLHGQLLRELLVREHSGQGDRVLQHRRVAGERKCSGRHQECRGAGTAWRGRGALALRWPLQLLHLLLLLQTEERWVHPWPRCALAQV